MHLRTPASLARTTRRALLALAAAPLLIGSAGAQQADWPAKMIKLVVPFPAGGPTDTASRILGQRLGERLKQTVVVENRPGASGSIAATQVAKSEPDGYTLMMLATPTLLAPHLYKKAGYDTVKDFAPVATVYDLPIAPDGSQYFIWAVGRQEAHASQIRIGQPYPESLTATEVVPSDATASCGSPLVRQSPWPDVDGRPRTCELARSPRRRQAHADGPRCSYAQ